MLAQSFLDASALSIPETHRQALMKTLVLLETGKLVHVARAALINPVRGQKGFTGHFNMSHWRTGYECGSVCCIGGTAEIVGDVLFGDLPHNDGLGELFYAKSATISLREINPAQAAIALRSYLTTGAANWEEALATS
jgi:hypothetical protein